MTRIWIQNSYTKTEPSRTRIELYFQMALYEIYPETFAGAPTLAITEELA